MVAVAYDDLIEESILTLNETNGSSRQDIWKAVRGMCPMVNYKYFVVELKRMRDAGKIVQKGATFRLESIYKRMLLKALEMGKRRTNVSKFSVSLKPGAKKTAAKKSKDNVKKGAKKAYSGPGKKTSGSSKTQ